MLCPKGVKRYLQGGHPDRLLASADATEQRLPAGIGWDEALGLHRPAPARDSGASTARTPWRFSAARRSSPRKRTCWANSRGWRSARRHIDYNGRLCMVSAGIAYKLAFGVDRSLIPWSEIPKAEVLFVIGANIGDCAPITTDYIWRCRDSGGRLIVADPRMTPITRNADLYLPVRPGTDLALLMGMLHVILREGLEDRAVHRRAHHRIRGSGGIGEAVRSAHGCRAHRRAAARRSRRPRTGSRRADAAIAHARARPRAPFEGRRELSRRDQPRARHRATWGAKARAAP